MCTSNKKNETVATTRFLKLLKQNVLPQIKNYYKMKKNNKH
jgi:hypothetical protein